MIENVVFHCLCDVLIHVFDLLGRLCPLICFKTVFWQSHFDLRCFALFGWGGTIFRSGGDSLEAICVELSVLKLEFLCTDVICALF